MDERGHAPREHAVAASAGSGTEHVGEEGLADADGPDDGDVRVGLEKAQRAQLVPQFGVVPDIGGRVPCLELMRGIESRAVTESPPSSGLNVLDLVGEDQQKKILVRHLLLPGEGEALGERVEDRASR